MIHKTIKYLLTFLGLIITLTASADVAINVNTTNSPDASFKTQEYDCRFDASNNYLANAEMAPSKEDYSQMYLTIESLEDNSTINFYDNFSVAKIISASTDNGATWTAYTSTENGTPIATLNTGEKVLLKGVETSYNGTFFFSFEHIKVYGNIMSLLYGDNFAGQKTLTANYTFQGLFYNCTGLTSAENLVLPATTLTLDCYSNMFYDCTSLTTAPALPATSLAESCYSNMFHGCTSLTVAPELPATTLAQYCYVGMFDGCTSLTVAPELPVTTLADYCYYAMFRDCTSLTTAPELPATTLAEGCYDAMFFNCSSLTTTPVLPATTLAEWCYQEMFWECTSLTTAPVLPATTLVELCYGHMFYGCTNLNYIKCLATDISAGSCTQDWVEGVAASGTFVKAASTRWATGTSGIPEGWTMQNAGIEVNATNFPDAEFRSWIMNNISGASDGWLTDAEIAEVKKIDCSGTSDKRGSIVSLQGIEFFTSLTQLYCDFNQLTSLDVSKNTALTNLYCGHNLLTILDVSNNTVLADLYCSSNQLTSLDVSKNTKLTKLRCQLNLLTSLDVSKNTALTYLSCRDNQLTSLDVSKNTALTTLLCWSNQLTSLDVSNNTALEDLECFRNQLTSLDVSNNAALTDLRCRENKLTSLDVSKNKALTKLQCYSNQLTSLDVSNNTVLADLNCRSNLLTNLDLSKNPSINWASIGSQFLSMKAVSTSAGIAIPMPSDFDFTKVSNLKLDGASVSGSFATFNGQKFLVFAQAGMAQGSIDGKQLTYDYSTGNSFSEAASMDVTVSLSYDAPKSYTLSIQSGSGGSVSYDGTTVTNATKSFTVVEGTSATISILPNSGYKLSKLTVNGTNVTSSVSNNQYTISNITANTSVVATFEQITYTLSVQATGMGVVSYNNNSIKNASRTYTVNHGASATLTITPDAGYRLASLTVNGTNLTSSVSNGKYTVSNITANTSVVATFELTSVTTYTLSIQSGSGGSVSYDGTTITNSSKSFTVARGSSATVTITPNTGYKLSKLTVNGTNVTSFVLNNQYTISNITANTTVVASFEQITYTLSVKASGNGTVTYNGNSVKNMTRSFTVTQGSSATLTITPDSGYRLASLTVDGTNVTGSVSNGKYTITNITADTSVIAIFEEIPATTYTLSIQSGSGGSISYEGTTITNTTKSFTVAEGSSAMMTITPNDGYRLASLTENGTNVTSNVSNGKYTINSITANTSVVATFEQIPVTTYTLSIQAGSGGSVSYEGTTITNTTKSFTVAEGSSASMTITPNDGYRLASLTVNGTNVTSSVSNGNYTISSITANTSVVATFEEIPATTYTLSIQSGNGGSVSYNGTTVADTKTTFTVTEGEDAILVITPDNGYQLVSLTVDGRNVTSEVADGQYTIRDIRSNTTVVASFEQITITLSVQATGNGSVIVDNIAVKNSTRTFTVGHGTTVVLSFHAEEGCRLSSLSMNGTNVTSGVIDNQYKIVNITSDISVSATFKEIPQAFSQDGIDYEIESEKDHTLNVGSGEYSGHVVIPATVTHGDETWTVTGVADGAFDTPAITAITWNPPYAIGSGAFGNLTNPNLLLYVKDAAYAPENVQNVIANGRARKIVLTDAASGNDFDCPKAFTAEEISYTHRYSMTTGIGECRGWETITLPFKVRSITHETKGALVPFKVYRGTHLPFWLYEWSASGFVEASGIEANTPYIISFPNNDYYYSDYLISGNITFSSENVTVISSSEMNAVSGKGNTFIPNYSTLGASIQIYPLNVQNDYCTHKDYYLEGSTFVQELRTVHPFEAYMTTSSNNAKSTIPIFDTTPTGISILLGEENGDFRIYSLAGQLVRDCRNTTYEEAIRGLAAGVYLVNGKKLYVKP